MYSSELHFLQRYHTPTRSKSRSASVEERGDSETPPHWKEEMKRTKVYQPPSIERWSKGDKYDLMLHRSCQLCSLVFLASCIFWLNRLNDHSSSRWDNRSDSAWSRSAEHSSDRSSERSSQWRQQRKQKKKAKHKKKAKKRKRSKKKSSKNKGQECHLSEGERSVSSERKSRRSRSTSRSSSDQRHSSARGRRQSSLSFRDSRSYSRSYTSSHSRSRGRSRSYSRSRSFSRSRSRSLSRSRSPYSRSRSKSRSRSRYRSRSSSRKRSSSRSRRKRKANKPKHQPMIQVQKLPDSTATSVPRLPTAAPVPETVPVIPLSDSPPPSRWKPGQKPWKPSYIHIQEIKAKVAANISSTGQTADSKTEKCQASVTAKCLPGDSESDKARKPAGRSHSRSPRSKTYSRSYSRSRSRSYSRSRSRSRSPRYHSRSSSYSRSDSENSQKKRSNKTPALDEEWKGHYSSLNRIKKLDKYISLTSSQDAPSASENRAGGEYSPEVSVSKRSGTSEKIKGKGGSQDQEMKLSSAPVESFKCKSEWDSDSDKVSQSNSATLSKRQKEAVQPSEVLDKKLATGWNSESDSENITARTVAISEKEEGEASSESENETCRKTSEAVDALTHKIAAVPSSRSEVSPEKAAEPEKHKSKKKAKRKHKHKRRGVNKSGSHHSKDKGKRSKRKHQKLRETFHWQPPLEFGEEEEEDESKRDRQSPGKAVRERPAADSVSEEDQQLTSLNKNPTREEEKEHQRTKHSEPQLQSSSRNGANLPNVKEQESLDDMDICTPEHGTEIVELPAPQDSASKAPELNLKPTSKSSDRPSKDGSLPHSKEQPSVTSTTAAGHQQDEATTGKPTGTAVHFKWRPLKGMSALQNVNMLPLTTKDSQPQDNQTSSAKGVRMEIKSKSRVRPGSLFDEVRKTARLNQRPRNQESSSEERSPSAGTTRGGSRAQSPKKSRSGARKSRSVSSHRSHSRGWSRSYSRSRSRSRSSSYSSRWGEGSAGLV